MTKKCQSREVHHVTFKKGLDRNDPHLAPAKAIPLAYSPNETAWLDTLEGVIEEIDSNDQKAFAGVCVLTLAKAQLLQGSYIRAAKGQSGSNFLRKLKRARQPKKPHWLVPIVEMDGCALVEMIPPPWIETPAELDEWMQACKHRMQPGSYSSEAERWFHETIRNLDELVLLPSSDPGYPEKPKLARLAIFLLRTSLSGAKSGLTPGAIRRAFLAGVEFNRMERLSMCEDARRAAQFSPGNSARRPRSKKEALREILLNIAPEIGPLPKADRFVQILETRGQIEKDTGHRFVIRRTIGTPLSWESIKTFKNAFGQIRKEEAARQRERDRNSATCIRSTENPVLGTRAGYILNGNAPVTKELTFYRVTFLKGSEKDDSSRAPKHAIPIPYGPDQTAWLHTLEGVLSEISSNPNAVLTRLCKFSWSNGVVTQEESFPVPKGSSGQVLAEMHKFTKPCWLIAIAETGECEIEEMTPPPWISNAGELDQWLNAIKKEDDEILPSSDDSKWLLEVLGIWEKEASKPASEVDNLEEPKLASTVFGELRQAVQTADQSYPFVSIQAGFEAGRAFNQWHRLDQQEKAAKGAKIRRGRKLDNTKEEFVRRLMDHYRDSGGNLPTWKPLYARLQEDDLVTADDRYEVIIQWRGATRKWKKRDAIEKLVSRIR